MDITTLTPGQLKRAAAIKERIERLNKELNSLLNGGRATPQTKRTMSAAVRRKIAAAQRKRWAKIKKYR